MTQTALDPAAAAPSGAEGYYPIESYGVIGNLRTAALVGLHGSVDWCCFPDLDSPSVFAAILDRRRGGRFRVAPSAHVASRQRYLPDTNVLETSFETSSGRLTVTDFMPVRGPLAGVAAHQVRPRLIRLVACTDGEVDVDVEWSPRFDYARAATRIERHGRGLVATGGDDRMTLAGLPVEPSVESDEGGPTARARFRLRAGERVALDTTFGAKEPRADLARGERALAATADAWRAWAHRCETRDAETSDRCVFFGQWHDLIVRSGLVLKLLTYRHTGAIAAAATTSLPEVIGGVRNWDYRYTWIRDAAFTAQALYALGHHTEALDFLAWVHGAAKMRRDERLDLRIMYGLRGETKLTEYALEHLEGYRGSRPVRVGNAASAQRQLDIYGELLAAAYEFTRLGGALDAALWEVLRGAADDACDFWREPDNGIWEVRHGPRHFVFSKVMAWVALDRAIRLAKRFRLPAPLERWRRERRAVREAVLTHGYDRRANTFTRTFGDTALDAANLLIPVVEFLPFDDPRVQGTIDATRHRLAAGDVVYRYLTADGLPGQEGAFGLTTFWLISALALSGRTAAARELFASMAGRVNHLGLYAEEFDPRTNAFLGNFPQAFTHIGLVNSALYLGHAEGRRSAAPAPVGSREHREETGHDAGAAA